MPDPLTGAKATIKVGKALLAANKHLQKGSLQDKFDDAAKRLNENMGQVAYAVCKGFVARALGHSPGEAEVEEYMAGAVDDPTFPARAHLLTGAMRKTSSNERLRMLAGMLFGKAFMKTPPADLERVDLLAERLLIDDVRLLSTINGLWQRLPDAPESECIAMHASGLRLFRYPSQEPLTQEYLYDRPVISQTAFDALLSAGCISMPDGFTLDGLSINGLAASHGAVDMTALGEMFLRALDDVRVEVEPASSG